MNRKKIRRKVIYYLQYFPFTINTLLFCIAGIAVYKLLYRPLPVPEDDPSPFLPFILLMVKISFWFILALISLSILSTITCWLYYLWLRKSKNIKLELNFSTETRKNQTPKLYLNTILEGVRRPVLGFIKARLFYDDYELTDTFSLLSNKRKEKSLWRSAISGRSRLKLPDIKEYELKGGFILFQDMLHLFSLAVAQPVSGRFYQPPVLRQEDDEEVFPKKTENMDVRIEQMRKVEGEYLNYKDFEAGDDVRRIVWKVYAKNRDLVVRVPEMFEPYASHLYFYASFHAAVNTQWLGDTYLKEMLNYYKNCIWTTYDTLSRKEWEIRYIPDQSFTLPDHLKKAEQNARIISSSEWHQDTGLSDYFRPQHGAVLCISSFTDPDDLENVLEQCDGDTVVYFVKCSQVFRHFVAWHWLKRIFILPPQDRLNRIRAHWIFSPMRLKLHKREKALEDILRNSSVRSAVL